jgi:hypothetical protein
MKDIIKRWIITIIALFVIIYLIYCSMSWITITNSAFLDQNSTYYTILILIFLYTAIIHWIYPIHIKINKPVLFFLWIALIIIWKTALNNDWQSWTYFWDIFVVFGVIITLLARTNTLMPQKIINKRKSKKIEVIEV